MSTIHLFNPENDLALACNDAHYVPPPIVSRMGRELALLPAVWAHEHDVLYVAGCPVVDWGNIDRIEPWGWSRALINRLQKMGVPAGLLPSEEKMDAWRDLSSRKWAVQMLQHVLHGDGAFTNKWRERLCGEAVYATHEEDVATACRSWQHVMLKAPWSGSGRGLYPWHGDYAGALQGWARKVLSSQQGVVVERLLDKCADLALEFVSDGKGNVSYAGLSLFYTQGKGAYQGSLVATEDDKWKLVASCFPIELFHDLIPYLETLLSVLLGTVYEGVLGVDMMLCSSLHDAHFLQLNPCVEINLRKTMGWVSVVLSEKIKPGVRALFRLDYMPQEGALYSNHAERVRNEPLTQEDELYTGGYWPLTMVTARTCWRASVTSLDKETYTAALSSIF